MNPDDIIQRINTIVQKTSIKNKMNNTQMAEEDKETLAHFIAEIAYDSFVDGFNTAVEKMREKHGRNIQK